MKHVQSYNLGPRASAAFVHEVIQPVNLPNRHISVASQQRVGQSNHFTLSGQLPCPDPRYAAHSLKRPAT